MNYIDLDNICRSCTMSVDLQPMQDNFVIDLFQKLIDVNYSKTDGLPQKICETCIQTIYSIQTFVLQCKTNGITLKKYLSMSKNNSLSTSENTSTEEDNKATLFLTINSNRTIQHEIQPEELINDAINCSNETIDLEMNDHVLENNEFNMEHSLEHCETIEDGSVLYEVNTEDENFLELNMETEETTIVNNEVNIESPSNEAQILTENTDQINNETQILTENTDQINNETQIPTENTDQINNEINEINKTNTTIRESVTIETDIISVISSDSGNEDRINDRDIERRVNLGNLLSELQKQYPFHASADLLNRELDSVSLRGGEFDDENNENVQDVVIPLSHLLQFDDNIVIIDRVS